MQTLTIPAHEVLAGDYLETTFQNGRSGGSIAIGHTTYAGTTIYLHAFMATHEFNANDLVTVERF